MVRKDWQGLAFAQQFRDIVAELVAREVQRLRPPEALATVDTIDSVNGVANVIFPGDTNAVPVKLYSMRPITGGGVGVGDVVRVRGPAARRYVADVVSGGLFINAGRMALTMLETTASAANMYVDATTGVVYRSTSSLRYKQNVKTTGISDRIFMKLRPVTYQQRDSKTGQEFLGMIAEEIAELNDPVLNKLVVNDLSGKPDAINYDRIAVILIPVIQRLIARVGELESRIPNDEQA